MTDYIKKLPKSELHVHLEGTFEPKQVFEFSKKNNISLPYKTTKDLKAAYKFDCLQSFLDIYYLSMSVLITEQDFFELTMSYLKKARENNVVHVDLFFDPQAHTARGIKVATFMNGISKACIEHKKRYGLSYNLIPCFLRHLSEKSGIKIFKELKPFSNAITGFGLDSGEKNNPPKKFKHLFQMVKEKGYRCVSHAGEEGGPQNIWDSLNLLNSERIDHGISLIDDPKLLSYLREKNIPLTMCPLSNLSLKVLDNLSDYPFRELLKLGVMITINSDDPAYFGGYLNDNLIRLAKDAHLTKNEIKKTVINGFKGAFLPDEKINYWIRKINEIEQ